MRVGWQHRCCSCYTTTALCRQQRQTVQGVHYCRSIWGILCLGDPSHIAGHWACGCCQVVAVDICADRLAICKHNATVGGGWGWQWVFGRRHQRWEGK